MTALHWTEIGRDILEAHGTDWTYLVIRDDRTVVLTRFEAVPDFIEVARQAALHAIQIRGAYEVVPETAVSVAARLKQDAQQYESGLDLSWPAWQHGRQPEPEAGERG